MFTFYNASVFGKQYPRVTFLQCSNGFTDVRIYDDGFNESGGYYLNSDASSDSIMKELVDTSESVWFDGDQIDRIVDARTGNILRCNDNYKHLQP